MNSKKRKKKSKIKKWRKYEYKKKCISFAWIFTKIKMKKLVVEDMPYQLFFTIYDVYLLAYIIYIYVKYYVMGYEGYVPI